MRLRQTTIMAYQAAIAIALAELICMYFYVDRHDWVTLTAMALTTQTWGESIRRSFERVGMTMLGGSLGTLFYFFLPAAPMMFFFLVLFFIFCMVYTATINSLVFLFFLTCFIVFIFALLDEWSLTLLRARIVDTGLGAFIALIVGYFFSSSKTNVALIFEGVFQKMEAYIVTVADPTSSSETLINAQRLLADFKKIKKNAVSIRYELLFHRLNAHDFNVLLNNVLFCMYWMVRILNVSHWLGAGLREEDQAMILMAVKTTTHNFRVIRPLLRGDKQGVLVSMTSVFDVLNDAVTTDPTRFAILDDEAVSVFNVLYFFNRLNQHLHDIHGVLCHVD